MKNRKILHITTILIYAGIIGVLSVWNVLAPKETVSYHENRTLAPTPSLSASHIFGGNFDDDFENWFSDHFVKRDFWIELKAALRKGMMAIENNEIYFANHNRLVSRFASVDERVLEGNVESVQLFLEETGTTGNLLFVPTAAWGAKSDLPDGAWDVDQEAMLADLKDAFEGQAFIDYTAYAAPNPTLYFRTDHHWNEQGAYLGYAAIAEKVLNKEPNHFTYEKASANFAGTMYSKSGAFWTAPDSIFTILPEEPVEVTVTFDNGETLDSIYSKNRLLEKDKYTYYADGNHPRADIHTSIGNGKKAVIVKDSYSHILMPFLITEYEDIILIDLRYYRLPVSELVDESTDFYVIYSLDNFASDPNIAFLR